MKKIILIFLLTVTLLVLFMQSIHAINTPESPRVNVTLISQTPDPVEPGQIVTIKFKIQNEGKETSNNAIVRILPQSPFTLYNDNAEKNIGKLRASTTGADAVIVEFKLKVNENAVEEETELELEVQLGDGKVQYTDNEFTIDIQTQDAVLDIKSITFEPTQIKPGETGRISITVRNLADSLLKDIKIKLDLTSATLPLAPYQSSSERIIPQLESNFQDTLLYDVIATPDATPGLHKVPINITYFDEDNKQYRINDILAVQIGDQPKIRAFLRKTSSLEAGSNAKVTISLANAGSSDLKFVELNLLPSDSYELLGASRYFYIGDVDADDTESEELELYIHQDQPTLTIPLKVDFLDANNRPFVQEFTLELPLFETSELQKYGVIQNSSTLFIITLLIIGGVGFYIYHRYRKKQK